MSRTRKKKNWEPAFQSLTAEQKDKMLFEILKWQIDDLEESGDIRFSNAYQDDESFHPADFYWDSCGDSLIGNDE